MTIFDVHQKIHRRNIQEAEDRRIDNWLKHIDNNTHFVNDVRILYMAAGNESNRVIKILTNYIIKKWDNNYTQQGTSHNHKDY